MKEVKYLIDYDKWLCDAPSWFTSRKKISDDAWRLVQMQLWSRMWFILGWILFFWKGRVKTRW